MSLEEEQNFYKLAYIVVNIVTEALRNVFKTEWDKRYPTTPWLDNPYSLNEFMLKEGTPSYRSQSAYTQMSHTQGKRENWDITILGYALLNSRPISLYTSDPNLARCVNTLRNQRNEVMHSKRFSKTNTEFTNLYTDIETEMKKLGPSYNMYVLQMAGVKNQTTQPTNDEINILKDALRNERTKFQWQNLVSVLVLIAAFACACFGYVKLSEVAEEVNTVRETLKPPSKEDVYLMKQVVYSTTYRAKYLTIEVFGFCMIILSVIYIWRRLYSVEVKFLPWNVIPDFPDRLHPDFFRGRKQIIDDTVNCILDGAIFTVFTGPPGIGKTATSVVAAKQLRDKHGFTICLVEVRGMVDIQTVTERVFKAFCGEYRDFTEQGFDDFFRRRIKNKTLLLIDNAEDILTPELIKETKQLLLRMVNYNKNVHVLLTSRKQIDGVADYKINIQRIGALTPDESCSVLTSDALCPHLVKDKESAKEIGQICGGVPLLLSIAGKQLRRDLRHVKRPEKQEKVIVNFLVELKKKSVLVTLNEDDEPDERSMIKCLDVLFSRLNTDLLETYLALSVFEVSFSDDAAESIVPHSSDKIFDLLDYNILNDVYMNKDRTAERYSMHPLLQEYSRWKLTMSENMQRSIRSTEENFHIYFIKEMKVIANRFFSSVPHEALVKFSEDESNFRKTLMRGLEVKALFEKYYDMIVSAADLLLFGFDDKLVSTFFDYAAEDAKQRNDMTKYMALLFLQGDRGDVYFYHHKDKYNKIQKLVDTEVVIITGATLQVDEHATRETAYALCVQGRVFALYSSRSGWSKEAEKVDDFEKGKSKVKQAIELLEKLNLQHDKAIGLCLLGLLMKNRRCYHDAIAVYTEALSILKGLYGEHALIGAIHYNIGYMYYKLGRADFINGKNEFLKSYEVYEKTLGNHKRTASAMFHAGECLNMFGNLEESLPYFFNSLRIQEIVAPRDRDISETLMSIAEVNYKLGKYKEALPYFERCLKIMTFPGVMSTPKHREIAYAYKRLAHCQWKLNLIENAKENFKVALDIFIYVFAEHKRCKEEIDSVKQSLQEIGM